MCRYIIDKKSPRLRDSHKPSAPLFTTARFSQILGRIDPPSQALYAVSEKQQATRSHDGLYHLWEDHSRCHLPFLRLKNCGAVPTLRRQWLGVSTVPATVQPESSTAIAAKTVTSTRAYNIHFWWRAEHWWTLLRKTFGFLSYGVDDDHRPVGRWFRRVQVAARPDLYLQIHGRVTCTMIRYSLTD